VPVKIWLVLVIRVTFRLSAYSISASRARSRHLILDQSPHLPCLGVRVYEYQAKLYGKMQCVPAGGTIA
jgi:hypothetical protein